MLIVAAAAGALSAPNLIKRLACIVLAQVGAVLAASTLGAGSGVVVAAIAVAFVQTAVGAALIVRLQESYGGVETPEIDAADAGDDAEGPPS